MEEPVPTGTTGDDGHTEYMSPPVWQTVLGSGLSVREEAAADWTATILWMENRPLRA